MPRAWQIGAARGAGGQSSPMPILPSEARPPQWCVARGGCPALAACMPRPPAGLSVPPPVHSPRAQGGCSMYATRIVCMCARVSLQRRCVCTRCMHLCAVTAASVRVSGAAKKALAARTCAPSSHVHAPPSRALLAIVAPPPPPRLPPRSCPRACSRACPRRTRAGPAVGRGVGGWPRERTREPREIQEAAVAADAGRYFPRLRCHDGGAARAVVAGHLPPLQGNPERRVPRAHRRTGGGGDAHH